MKRNKRVKQGKSIVWSDFLLLGKTDFSIRKWAYLSLIAQIRRRSQNLGEEKKLFKNGKIYWSLNKPKFLAGNWWWKAKVFKGA